MDTQLTRGRVARLFAEHDKPLFNIVYRWVWDRDDAAELVQEAFVRLWDARAKVDATTARAYLYRIALNLAASRRRWKRLRIMTGIEAAPPSDEPDPDQSAQARQQAERVRQAIEHLPQRLRKVIVLCELSYGEVAAVLGIKLGTVGSRRNAALVQLRRVLQQHPEEPSHVRT